MKFVMLVMLAAQSFLLTAQRVSGQTATGSPEIIDLFRSDKQNGVACFRIPAMVTAPNGDLIVAVDERVPSCGDLRSNKNINIVVRRSKDNGNTWNDAETIVDYPLGKSASDPSLIVDKVSGEIFLFYNFMDLDKEKDVYYLKYVKSKDNGKSWDPPVDITNQISKSAWHKDFKFITSGRGIQTKAGKLLHTLVNLDNGLHLFGSDDHGESWHLLDAPITPADESKVVELEDGSWMINSRLNGSGIRYVHLSEDHGKTWLTRPDSSLIDPGCNASLIKYIGGNSATGKSFLLFSNANSLKDRQNLSVRVSFDEGENWSAGKTIYGGSAAYSSMTILSNGDIGVIFEKDDYTSIAFARFTPGWLLH